MLTTPQCNDGVCGAVAACGYLGATRRLSSGFTLTNQTENCGKETGLTVKGHSNSGFTMIEALMVVAIGLLLGGMAIPIFTNAMKNYYQTSTVSAAAGAIQSTRFQAIMHGYPYQITFTSSTMSYQVYAESAGVTCPSAFSAVGYSHPLALGRRRYHDGNHGYLHILRQRYGLRDRTHHVALHSPQRRRRFKSRIRLSPTPSRYQEWEMCQFPARRQRGEPDGFTLLEVVVAITVLAIGLMASALFMSHGYQFSVRSRYMAEAAQLCSEKLEDLGRFPEND